MSVPDRIVVAGMMSLPDKLTLAGNMQKKLFQNLQGHWRETLVFLASH